MDVGVGGRDEYEDLDFVRERESMEIYARRDRQRKSHALRSNVINLFDNATKIAQIAEAVTKPKCHAASNSSCLYNASIHR